ncbi:hypothetical protein AAFC00_006364 [Neodothiora populina]|uniref:Uncharacterized protein n=1 Tax=Neodothiora populina TaxID=2781224 RepID=A0ABR3P4Y1_9PEZI
MDEFAQTGAQQDDLFDDIQYAPGGEESMQTRAPDDLFGEEFTPVVAEHVEEKETPQVHTGPPPASARQRGGGGRGNRGSGQGRGGRGRGRGEHHQQREQRSPAPAPVDAQQQEPAASADEHNESQTAPATADSAADSSQPDSASATNTPSTTTTATAAKPSSLFESRHASTAAPTESKHGHAARGDRRATGGLQKPKLSASELEAKMQRMSLRSAELTERHKRAEADRQSFDKREEVAKEVAKQRTKEERRDRQQMMGEREKNRLRKLKAMEGREWDMQKQEEDYDPRAAAKRGGSGRGAYGGVVGPRDGAAGPVAGQEQQEYTDGREYMYRENKGRGNDRGGRGRGRGGRGASSSQSLPRHSDFPELPPTPAVVVPKDTPSAEATSSGEAALSTLDMPALDEKASAGGKRWADMVDG